MFKNAQQAGEVFEFVTEAAFDEGTSRRHMKSHTHGDTHLCLRHEACGGKMRLRGHVVVLQPISRLSIPNMNCSRVAGAATVPEIEASHVVGGLA